MKQNFSKSLTSYVRCFGIRPYLEIQKALFALAMLACMVTASAEVIGWHPAINAQVGDAINFNDPTIRRNFGTTQSDVTLIDTGSISVSGLFTQSKRDLSKALSVSASVDVKSAFFDVAAKVDFVQKQSFSANTVNFAVKYWKNFPDEIWTDFSMLTSIRNRISDRVNDPDVREWIRKTYGTHYVRGYKKSAYAVVAYRFTTQSTSFSQELRARLNAGGGNGFTTVRLNAEVEKAFSESRSAITLQYEFLGSDPNFTPNFPITGKIDSLAGFIEFGQKVEAYARELKSENARITGYIVEDIKRFPGFPEAPGLQGQLAADTNYDEFLKIYEQLGIWREILNDWLLTQRGLTWLKQTKIDELKLLFSQIESLRTSMRDTALEHFNEGTPLSIEDPLFDAAAIFSRIPEPRVNIVTAPKIGDGGIHVAFGFIDCGPKDSVTEVPFSVINLQNPDTTNAIFYSGEEWLDWIRQLFGPGRVRDWVFGGGIEPHAMWTRLFAEAENGSRRVGFFATTSKIDLGTSYSLHNGAGQIMDAVEGNRFFATLGGEVLQAANQADAVLSGDLNLAVTRGKPVTGKWVLRNDGPGANVTAELNTTIPKQLSVSDARVSKGNYRIEDANLTWDLGLLGFAREAVIEIDFEGAETGDFVFEMSSSGFLTDPNAVNNRLFVEGNVVEPPKPPPTIVNQPRSQSVAVGADITFTVTGDGIAPLTYQWLKDDSIVAGKTSSTLTISSVQADDAGSYSVVVSNSGGSVTSNSATLTVVRVGFVDRFLGGGYLPGVSVTVTLQALPASSTQSYLIEDQPPANWVVSGLDSGGSFDSANGKVKFGPFFDNSSRTLTYQVTPPSDDAGEKCFSGLVSADGENLGIGGDRCLDVVQRHPADINGPAFRLTAEELTGYGAAWKRGTEWQIGPNPIPPDYLSRAGFLWKTGECYGLDPALGVTPPLVWISIPCVAAQQLAARPAGPVRKSLPATSIATSSLPATYELNVAMTVTVDVKPGNDVFVYLVEDNPPIGWIVSSISGGGVFEANNKKVKWGPFFDNVAREFSYQVTPPSAALGMVMFNGIASFDGVNIQIAGQRSTSPQVVVLPNISIAATDPNASEASSDRGIFTITRTGSTTGELTVSYSAGGTATNAGDYNQLSGSISIPAGSVSATETVTPVDDALVEGEETVIISISNSSAYTVGTSNRATVTISDNDDAPPVDSAGPNLAVISHNQSQTVSTSTIVLSGTASDSGRGNNGILSVTVNNVAAVGGSAGGSSSANWSQSVTLVPGANTLMVVAKDSSASQNPSSISLVITYEPPLSTAVSAMPTTYVQNTPFTVTITVMPAETVTSYLAEDQPPVGWTVSDLGSGGSFDANNRKVKWGPFFDNAARELSYQVTPPSAALGTVTFDGIASFDGANIQIAGQRITSREDPAPSHTKGDFNDDDQPDILFQDDGGFLAAWFMKGSSLSSAVLLLPSNVGDPHFTVAATADLNMDGQEDILFQGDDGTLAAWLMQGTDLVTSTLLTPNNPGDANWRVAASGDMNRDGKADLIFQHTDGTLAVWYMDGTSLNSAALISPTKPGADWSVVAAGDMNSDGKTDLVFQHTNGTLAMWVMDGVTLSSAALLEPSNPGADWRVVAAGPIANRLATSLSGAAERPTPVTTPGTGSGTATLVGDQLTFSIVYSGLSGAAVAAHIHGPATTERAAGVLIDLAPFNGGAFGESGTLSGTVTLTSAQVSNLRSGLTYVNIHTAANQGGELRGQITADASKAGQIDLIFQHSDLTLAVWFMDGGKLSSAQLLDPSNAGGSWKVVGPK